MNIIKQPFSLIRTTLINSTTAAALFVFLPTSLLAVEPAPVSVGSLDFIPTLTVRYGHNDNVLLEEADPLSSSMVLISPSIRTSAEGESSRFALTFDATDVDYADSPQDSYTDWSITGNGALRIHNKHALELNASFESTHEFRGTEFSEDLSILLPVPSDYDNTDFRIDYIFGSETAKSNLTFSTGLSDRNYTNNRAVTLLQDFQTETHEITYLYRAKEISDYSIRFLVESNDYDVDVGSIFNALGNRDSKEEYIYLGWDWRPRTNFTASTSIGYGERSFSSALREGGSIPSWDISLSWNPLSYSNFTLSSSSIFTETFAQGNSVESKSITLAWTHTWVDRFSSFVSLNHVQNEFSGIDRNDDRENYTIGFTYNARRWVDVTFDWTIRNNDSNIDLISYEQNVLTLGFLASL